LDFKTFDEIEVGDEMNFFVKLGAM